MKLRKQIKLNARRALGGSWGKAICLLLIIFSISLIFSLLQGLTSLLLGIPDFSDVLTTPQYYLDDVINLSIPSFLIAAAFTLFSLIVNSPLSFGIRLWYYRLAGGDSEEVAAVFSFFSGLRLFFKAIWHDISLSVRLLLWSIPFALLPGGIGTFALFLLYNAETARTVRLGGFLLLTLACVLSILAGLFFSIFSKRYLLAPYLIVDNPSISVRQAFRTSIRYTRGYKNELFLFDLSFLPWALLSVLLLPLLYVVPYYNASLALYAKYLVEKGKLNEPEDETLRFDPRDPVTGEIPEINTEA